MNRRRLLRVVIALVLLTIPAFAVAHGDAEWIMSNPDTRYCCGPSDCTRLPKSAVSIGHWGYAVVIGDGMTVVPMDKVLRSNDDDYWACVPPGQPLKCFFAPPLGA